MVANITKREPTRYYVPPDGSTQYSSPLLSLADAFQDPPPETADSTELYIYCAFSYTYTPMITFNL